MQALQAAPQIMLASVPLLADPNVPINPLMLVGHYLSPQEWDAHATTIFLEIQRRMSFCKSLHSAP